MLSWKKLVFLPLMLIGVLWLCTGGIVVYHYRIYESDSRFVGDEALVFKCSVITHVNSYGVPFLFLKYKDSLPYSIQLTVYDHQNAYSRLFVDTVSIEYRNGPMLEIVSPKDEFSKEFKDHAATASLSGEVTTIHSRQVSHTFKGVVDQPATFRLTIVVRFRCNDGSIVRKVFTEEFRRSTYSSTKTGWAWFFSLG
jgi:hypothetical protein